MTAWTTNQIDVADTSLVGYGNRDFSRWRYSDGFNDELPQGLYLTGMRGSFTATASADTVGSFELEAGISGPIVVTVGTISAGESKTFQFNLEVAPLSETPYGPLGEWDDVFRIAAWSDFGGEARVQIALSDISVVYDVADVAPDPEPEPAACFWRDLVKAVQKCGAGTDPEPVGVMVDYIIHYTCEAYEGTGINLVGHSGTSNGGPAVNATNALGNPPRVLSYLLLDSEPSLSSPLPGVVTVDDFTPLVGETTKFNSYGGGWLNISKYVTETFDPALVPGQWFAALVAYEDYGTSVGKQAVMAFRVKANDGSWPTCE